MNETDQWKLNGDCSKCRRKNYCNNECSVAKRRKDLEVKSIIRGALSKTSAGQFIEKHGGLFH